MAKYVKNKNKSFKNNWLVAMLFMVKKRCIVYSYIFHVQKDKIRETTYY